MAEARIGSFMMAGNRPYNVQMVTDFLACEGFKKAQVQKALDSLTESKRLTCKEWGKSKIYTAVQSAEEVSNEEIAAKQQEEQELKSKLAEEQQVVMNLKSSLQALKSGLSLAEIESQLAALQPQVESYETRLAELEGGAVLISPEERAKTQKVLKANMEHWKERRRVFNDIWDLMSENMERKKADLFEEICIEEDQPGATYAEIAQLVGPKKRRRGM